jgi:hypothetical protein
VTTDVLLWHGYPLSGTGSIADDRRALSEACRDAVVALWSWDSVARRMLTSAVHAGP